MGYEKRKLTLKFEIVCATENQYELWRSILFAMGTSLHSHNTHKQNIVESKIDDILVENLTKKKK